VSPECGRYREPTATESKTPSEYGWRDTEDKFSARLIESRDWEMSHQNAIREGSRIRPALNAAHGGGFRVPRKRPDVIDSKWSGREDLNLRPPGPEPENSPFLKSGKIRNWKWEPKPLKQIGNGILVLEKCLDVLLNKRMLNSDNLEDGYPVDSPDHYRLWFRLYFAWSLG